MPESLLGHFFVSMRQVVQSDAVLRIATFGEMNQAWQAWVSPQGLPTRATVEIGALAGPEFKVEIVVSAAAAEGKGCCA